MNILEAIEEMRKGGICKCGSKYFCVAKITTHRLFVTTTKEAMYGDYSKKDLRESPKEDNAFLYGEQVLSNDWVLDN